MSLENIQLPASVLRTLFKKTLVDLNSNKPQKTLSNSIPFNFLGENKAGVIIILNDRDNVHINDKDLEFLSGILSACKLTLADIALINLARLTEEEKLKIDQQLKSSKYILFGVEPGTIDLPFQIPFFQVQTYNSKKYLVSPSLTELQLAKDLKTKLWNSLQLFFELKK